MTRWNNVLPRGPTRFSVTFPSDIPRARMDTTSAPKSCTAPTKMAPRTIHTIAGSQPQMTAMAGPSIGDSPVIDAYWWPNST